MQFSIPTMSWTRYRYCNPKLIKRSYICSVNIYRLHTSSHDGCCPHFKTSTRSSRDGYETFTRPLRDLHETLTRPLRDDNPVEPPVNAIWMGVILYWNRLSILWVLSGTCLEILLRALYPCRSPSAFPYNTQAILLPFTISYCAARQLSRTKIILQSVPVD